MNELTKKIYNIPLEVNSKINYKKEYDGTECNSVISLIIQESYIVNPIPMSLPYLWTLSIEGKDGNIYNITGRTVEELGEALEALAVSSAYQGITHNTMSESISPQVIDQIKTGVMGKTTEDQPRHLIRVYGHQLQFQVLRNLYNNKFNTEIRQDGKIISHVLSKSPRSFITARAVGVFGFCDIQFMECEALTRKSLKEWANDMEEDIETDEIESIKTPITELSKEEIEKIEHKANIINKGIRIYRDTYNTLNNIPLTSTGITRRELEAIICSDEPWGENEEHGKKEQAHGSRWSRLCAQTNRNMKPEDYARLRQIFTGGLCIVSRFDRSRTLSDIDTYDIRSAYPSCLCHFKYPVDDFKPIPSEEFNKYLNEKDIMDINRKRTWYGHFIFKDLKSTGNIAYWPCNKFRPNKTEEDAMHISDGRLVSCSGTFEVYLTDLDYKMFQKYYTWESVETLEMWTARAELLPQKLIIKILEMFQKKENAKGRAREEAKVQLNSVYGIMVTRLYDDNVTFFDGWKSYRLDGKLFKDKHDRISPLHTVGSYQIGVWCTAWQRYILGTLAGMGTTYYGDTDSLFGHYDDFGEYHRFLNKRRREICEIYKDITPDMFGRLGYIEKENHFETFKMIGQKRYSGSYYDGETLTIKNTIAGISKTNADIKIKTPCDLSEHVTWNETESGLLCKIYNDNQPEYTWEDRDGKQYKSCLKYGEAVKPVGFSLSGFVPFRNLVEFFASDMYAVTDAPDPSDPLYIRESLNDEKE